MITIRTTTKNQNRIAGEVAFEQAYSRAKIIADIESIREEFCKHLLSCFLYPKSIHLTHWIKEMFNWFSDAYSAKLKSENAPLPANAFTEIIFEGLKNQEDIVLVANKVQKEYGKTSFDANVFYAKTQKIKSALDNLYDVCAKNMPSDKKLHKEYRERCKQTFIKTMQSLL